jgi:hypothetical protein
VDFPVFWIISAAAGWETRGAGARFLVGPALAISSSEQVSAAQARLDLAKPLFPNVSLVVSGRFAWVPDYRGDAFRLGAVGIGFRLR